MRRIAHWICVCIAVSGGHAAAACGNVVTLPAHDGATVRYSLALPPATKKPGAVLVLLAGGGGAIDLDAQGCPRALLGNSLVRSAPLFNGLGFVTALVDAPSDYPGEDGLAGFRSHPDHAADLGGIIADLRERTGLPIWLVGTSRGTISAVNAATRLSKVQAPDGVVLTSALMVGQLGARKPWVAQSVFDFPLETIRQPLLLIGHAADRCTRSPAAEMPRLMARIGSARNKVLVVTGGPDPSGKSGLDACEGKSPHGYHGQEDEVAQEIARFILATPY